MGPDLVGLGVSAGFCVLSGRIKSAVRKVEGEMGGEVAGGWRTCIGDEQWHQHRATP